MGARSQDDARRRSGLRLIGVGVVLFVIFGALFEFGAMLLGSRGPAQILFPIFLVATGFYLVAVRSGLLHGRRPEPPAPAVTDRPGEAPGAGDQ